MNTQYINTPLHNYKILVTHLPKRSYAVVTRFPNGVCFYRTHSEFVCNVPIGRIRVDDIPDPLFWNFREGIDAEWVRDLLSMMRDSVKL